jgi:DNA-binding response OmpR family regulator
MVRKPYITKTFDGQKLLARIDAVLRRVKGENKIEFKELV